MLNSAPKYKSHCYTFLLLSVLLGLFLSAPLPELRQDFEQRQQNRHTHGQEEWYVDGKLLIVRKVEEVEQWGVKEGSLWRREGFFAVLQGKAQVPSLQLSNSQLKWCDSAGYLRILKVRQKAIACLLYHSIYTLWCGSNLPITACIYHHTCSAMLSFITMFPIWSSSWASEVMVVVAVAMFSTLLLHIRRSSSQSASPALLHGAIMKPGGGADDCTPSNSLSEHGARQLTVMPTVEWIPATLQESAYRSWARKTPITLAMLMSTSTGKETSGP